MNAGIDLLHRTLDLLACRGVQCWVFGGWAEELHGLGPARAHRDVDLLCVGDDFTAVDLLFRDHPQLQEIHDKRFAHKRAFELDDVCVELFLVQHDEKGYFTTFWGQRHDWPGDVLSSASELPAASIAALQDYRHHWRALRRGAGGTQAGPAAGAHTGPVPLSDRLLARDVVGAYTGATIADVALVVGRGDVNQVHVVTTGDGARFVVRSHERVGLDRYQKEAWAIERAGAAGVPVAPVLAAGQAGHRAWMLQPFLRGTPGDEIGPGQRKQVWRDIGKQMRRIHAVAVGGFGETLSDLAAGSEESWHKYLAYNLGELTASDPLLSLGLLDRAAQAHLSRLFEHLATRPVRLGLCHGDLSLQNVIVRDRSVQVIDWGCAHGHLVPHYDLGVVLTDSLGEDSAEFAALLDGYGIDPASFRRDLRVDVLALGALVAVDKIRWAFDRNLARLPALAGRLATALRASGIGHQSASDTAPGR